MEKVKAILIDLDGTLADGMDALYLTYQQLLEKYGHTGTQEEFEELIGPSLPEVLQILNDRYALASDIRQLAEEYQSALRSLYQKGVPLFPGAFEFIQQADEKGYAIALVTSADRGLAEVFLAEHNLKSFFTAVITPEGLSNSKPSSDIYLKALDQLGIQPDEAVAIEDSYNGVLAATGAEIFTIHLVHRPEQDPFTHSLCTTVQGWDGVRSLFAAL